MEGGRRPSGLCRSTPCGDIATAADGDSPWRYVRSLSSSHRRSTTTTTAEAKDNDPRGLGGGGQTALKDNGDDSSSGNSSVIRCTRSGEDHSPPHLIIRPMDHDDDRDRNDRGRDDARIRSSFDDRRTAEAEAHRPGRRGGVVASRSAPSFRGSDKVRRTLSFWDRCGYDRQTIAEENGSVEHEGSFEGQTSTEEYSPITFNIPSTPGSARRSAIPVISYRRSLSTGSDDSSSQNFIFHAANNIGFNKPAVTHSAGQRALSNVTTRQRNDSNAANGAKQVSIVTSRQLLEGSNRFSLSSGGRTPSNVQRTLPRCKTTPSRLISENSEGLHRPSTAIPNSAKPGGRVSLNVGSSDRHQSKLPSRTVSQPGSRSTSPSGKFARLSFREPKFSSSRPTSARTDAERPSASHLRTSRIPRSQGQSRDASRNASRDASRNASRDASRNASRDASPSRSSLTSERYSHPLLSPRFFPGGHNSVGTSWKMFLLHGKELQTGTEMEQTLNDALEGTLSLQREEGASETSSISSDISHIHSNSLLNTSEMIALMSSASYSERRQGLVSLQLLMKSNGYLNSSELKRVTEIFTRMFHDPKPKVFSAFLETLVDVIEVHAEELNDWLYTCFSRLLVKLATDLLGSVQARIHKALQAICAGFAFEYQLAAIARFLAEQSLASNLRVRLAILDHLHEATLMTEPQEFVNSDCCRQVSLCVVQWTNEPKSSEIRKAAQNVVVALFNLNTPEFSAVLSKLPRSIQDRATRILHNHMYSVSQQVEPNVGAKVTSASHYDEADAMTSEDYFNSLKKTAEDIQSLSFLT